MRCYGFFTNRDSPKGKGPKMVILESFMDVKRHIRGMFNDSLHIFYIISCPQTHQLEKGSTTAKK